MRKSSALMMKSRKTPMTTAKVSQSVTHTHSHFNTVIMNSQIKVMVWLKHWAVTALKASLWLMYCLVSVNYFSSRWLSSRESWRPLQREIPRDPETRMGTLLYCVACLGHPVWKSIFLVHCLTFGAKVVDSVVMVAWSVLPVSERYWSVVTEWRDL